MISAIHLGFLIVTTALIVRTEFTGFKYEKPRACIQGGKNVHSQCVDDCAGKKPEEITPKLCSGYKNCLAGLTDEEECEESFKRAPYAYYTKAGFYDFKEAWDACKKEKLELMAPRLYTENEFIRKMKLHEKLKLAKDEKTDSTVVWVNIGIYYNETTRVLQYKGDEEKVLDSDFLQNQKAVKSGEKDNIQMNLESGEWRSSSEKSRIVCVEGYEYKTVTEDSTAPEATTPKPITEKDDLEWCTYAVIGMSFLTAINISYIVYNCINNHCYEKEFTDVIDVDNLKESEEYDEQQ